MLLVGALVLALATGVSRLDPAEVAPSAPALCAKPATLKVRTQRTLKRGLRGRTGRKVAAPALRPLAAQERVRLRGVRSTFCLVSAYSSLLPFAPS